MAESILLVATALESALQPSRARACAQFAEVRHIKLDEFQSDRLSSCCQSSRVCAVCRGGAL